MNENSKQQQAPLDELASFGKDAADFSSVERSIDLREVATRIRLGDIFTGPWFARPIDTLSPVHTVGSGRTNLTLIRPTVVQTDVVAPIVPMATFDRTKSPDRAPAVSVHVDPTGYGITTTNTYLVEFQIECSGSCTFDVSGFALGSPVDGVGSRTVTGRATLTVVLRNLPALSGSFAAITQTAGGQWAWFRTTFAFPPLVFEQA